MSLCIGCKSCVEDLQRQSAREAIVDVQHLFRPAHLQMLSNILKERAA